MKAALLGLGHPHSNVLFSTLENLTEITAISLWDPDPAIVARTPLAKKPKAKNLSVNIDAILSDPELTFAIVCVRHNLSAKICQRVIKAGKHLLAEKPVGLNSAEIITLKAAANRAGVVASVLYVRRAHPCMIATRQLLQTGTLGPMFSIEGRFLTTQVKLRQPESWLFQKDQAGGGILLWLGCHCLDLMQSVTGDKIVEVAALTSTRSREAIEVEDIAVLSLKFKSGAIGSFHAGYTLAYSGSGYVNQKGYDSYLAFNAREGRVVWPDLEPRLQIESPPLNDQSAIREETFKLPSSNSYGGSYGERFLRQFIAAVQGQAKPPTTLNDALRTARLIEAAAESSRTGQFIKIR